LAEIRESADQHQVIAFSAFPYAAGSKRDKKSRKESVQQRRLAWSRPQKHEKTLAKQRKKFSGGRNQIARQVVEPQLNLQCPD
jgi:hypothetical protein